MTYKSCLFVILICPLWVNAQNLDTSSVSAAFYQIPYKSGQIIYEKVYYLDSINNKEKIFNAVKSALIHNTNYKYSKVDEDRTAESITCEITFPFVAKPGIAKLSFTGKSNISFDIKENRYRVRLYNNSCSTLLLGHDFDMRMEDQYLSEKTQIEKGKWKAGKSTVLNWHESLTSILNGFGIVVNHGMTDDF